MFTTIFVVVSGRSTVTQAASWHPEPRGPGSPGSQLRWPTTTRILRWDVSAWTLRDRCEGHSRESYTLYVHAWCYNVWHSYIKYMIIIVRVNLYIYTHVYNQTVCPYKYVCIFMCIYISLCVSVEREREREKKKQLPRKERQIQPWNPNVPYFGGFDTSTGWIPQWKALWVAQWSPT